MTQKLATAESTNANFPSDAGVNSLIRRAVCDIFGTFGGATVKLQRSIDGGTIWTDIPSSSTTTATAYEVAMGENALIRANIAGGSGASLNVWLTPV